MTTPRVTVPEAIEALKHCVENEKAHWSLTEICDPCVDVPVKYLRAAVEALSAAPAPDAGAVSRDQVLAIVRQFASPSWCSVDRLVDTLFAALATREEAPAEAGSLEARPEREDYLNPALRAQPQAREEAQPVALTAVKLADALDWFWNAALGASRERQTETAADVASIMAQGMSAVAQGLREVSTLPAPEAEAEKMRMAVEALEFYADAAAWEAYGEDAIAVATDENVGTPLGLDSGELARQALAALQQEGRK